MGHVARSEECGKDFDGDVDDNKPLGLDGDGQGEDEDALFGKRHAESQKDGIDGSRCAHGGPGVECLGYAGVAPDSGNERRESYIALLRKCVVEFDILCHFLHKTCSDAAENVIKKEFLGSPNALHHTTEHPEGKHIEEQVLQSAMHKHIGEELINLEIRCQEEVQTEDIVEVDTLHPEHVIGGECQNVYYQKVFGNGRYAAHNI